MFYLSLIGSLIFELILSSTTLSSASDVHNNPKWKFVVCKDDITIYERWITITDNHKTRERKGEFQLESHFSDPVLLIQDEYEVLKWMSSAGSAEIIENTGETWISYFTFEAPWPFKKRDLVAEFQLYRDLFNDKTLITARAILNLLPLKEEVIRIESYVAAWEFQNNAEGLQVIFIAWSDTPPIVPRWIQDPITQKMFWQSLNDFRSEIREMASKENKLVQQTVLKPKH